MTDGSMSYQLASPAHASAAMRAIMSDRARLQRLLDFEAALARAEAALGVIGASAAVEIADACRAERYDIPALLETALTSGNLVGAAVEALAREIAKRDKAAAEYVHWGASQRDALDTALVLECRAAIDALLADIDVAIKGFVALAGRHRRTQTAARTALQQVLPMPLGLKLAGYAAALARARERLVVLRREALGLQFGGEGGTLAALGEHGFGVAERLAALLDLPLPDAPWHGHRDRLAEVAAAFGILAGTCGKIARDVALMMQSEVAEVSAPPVAEPGAASAAPHRRDLALAAAALSAAAQAPHLVATLLAAQVQEHEGGIDGSLTEWATFPPLALTTSAALAAIAKIAQELDVNADRLRANLERTGGRVMAEALEFALAASLGRTQARRLVQDLCARSETEKRPLRELLSAEPRVKDVLTDVQIDKLLLPVTYQGSAQLFIERLVFTSQTRAARRTEPRPFEPKPPVTLKASAEGSGDGALLADAAKPPPELSIAPKLTWSVTGVAGTAVATINPPDTSASAPPAGDYSTSSAVTGQQPKADDAAAPSIEDTGTRIAPTDMPAASASASEAGPVQAAETTVIPALAEQTPSALMEILSRAEAEIRATASSAGKHKRS